MALALIIWYGGLQSLEGTITVGVIAAFLQYAQRFFRPVQDLSEKYNLLQSAMASSERIFRLLDEETTVTDPPDPKRLSHPTTGLISFEKVWFAYDEALGGEPAWVLRNIDLQIKPGEKVALVGHTGAGKTTLINLLMRFYNPTHGQIFLDGLPIGKTSIKELRSRIGLVLQDVFLFSQDVGYNVHLGASQIDQKKIQEACERVGADRFIEQLEGGYGQPLGERGTKLSVGERQLISFARALAFDPEIRGLDEATSSLDHES